MKIIDPESQLESASLAIVASRYNSLIVDRLINGATSALQENGVAESDITMLRVPGAFEIPLAVKMLASRNKFDGIITLGAVVRGETPHFDYICTECAHGINMVSLEFSLPVAFGVLTVDTTEQALDRSGDEESNKGRESALTVLEMINAGRILEHE